MTCYILDQRYVTLKLNDVIRFGYDILPGPHPPPRPPSPRPPSPCYPGSRWGGPLSQPGPRGLGGSRMNLGQGSGLAVTLPLAVAHRVCAHTGLKNELSRDPGSRVAGGPCGVTLCSEWGGATSYAWQECSPSPAPPILMPPLSPPNPEPRGQGLPGWSGMGAGAGGVWPVFRGPLGSWAVRWEEGVPCSPQARGCYDLGQHAGLQAASLQCGHMPGTGWVPPGRACWVSTLTASACPPRPPCRQRRVPPMGPARPC